jgi:hypothetical protein
MAENGAGADASIVFEAAPFTEFVSKLYTAWKVRSLWLARARTKPQESQDGS